MIFLITTAINLVAAIFFSIEDPYSNKVILHSLITGVSMIMYEINKVNPWR